MKNVFCLLSLLVLSAQANADSAWDRLVQGSTRMTVESCSVKVKGTYQNLSEEVGTYSFQVIREGGFLKLVLPPPTMSLGVQENSTMELDAFPEIPMYPAQYTHRFELGANNSQEPWKQKVQQNVFSTSSVVGIRDVRNVYETSSVSSWYVSDRQFFLEFDGDQVTKLNFYGEVDVYRGPFKKAESRLELICGGKISRFSTIPAITW